MRARGKWQGMVTIVRLNWPFYLLAAAVLVASLCGFFLIPIFALRLVCGIVSLGAVYFLFSPLVVSHLIYDRSDLYRWGWLTRALHGAIRNEMIFCHSGFDDASLQLREELNDIRWQVLDHFDETQMTEASIRRARRMFPPIRDTLQAAYSRWPLAGESADVVFGLLAIHELRTEAERGAWFTEARRCLRRDGRVVLIEHIRDVANFIAFGPAFLHFHSRESWRRSWELGGFRCLDEFRVTPWVRVFVVVPAT